MASPDHAPERGLHLAAEYERSDGAEVIYRALKTKPPDGTNWSVHTMAEKTGVSKSTVQRWFDLFGIQPHRQRHFKISNDPFFVGKVRDIVGLYLNRPEHAVVLCAEEKSQALRFITV